MRDLLRSARETRATAEHAPGPQTGQSLSNRSSLGNLVPDDYRDTAGECAFDLSLPTVAARTGAMLGGELEPASGATGQGFDLTPAQADDLITRFAGCLGEESFPPGYLRRLRADWDR